MKNDHLFEVDESVERALHAESLHGKSDLMGDIRGGIHARAVIAEMNHANAVKAAGEQTFDSKDDFEFRLESIMHGPGFHLRAMQENTYECWDDDEFIGWHQKKHPELRVRHRSRNATIVVAGKYSPPRL